MATTVEQELEELEREYWQAIQDRDVEAAMRLTDFPCLVTGPHGVGRVDRQAFAAMMKEPPYELHRVDLTDDFQVRVISDEVAVVAYKVHEELTVDGKPVTLDAADTSTWIRRDGRWACAAHSQAIIGDPFGRSPSTPA